MNVFLLEIWSDLKEKRLWPVAALLVVALVAVPLVLAKPAEEAPAPAVDPTAVVDATAATGETLPAQLEEVKPLLAPSTLSEFASKDPFKPLRNLQAIEQAAGVAPTNAEPTSGGPSDGGPSDGGAKSGGGSDGGTGTPPVEEEKTVFTYQAVVELGTPSGTRTRKVNRLGILPKDTNPLLVFLGVSASDRGEAVFLVDSTVTQAGEGRCRPSATTCSFLSLDQSEGGNEHIFTTDDGKEYTIKLLEVRRVEVAKASAGSPKAQAGGPKTAQFASTDPQKNPFDGFDFPLFADEEE